jgi:protein-tyrosine phosphatase
VSALPRLEAVSNFRELGGLPTADGRRVQPRRIFRSGHWGRATDADRATMRSLGIRVVFDFRSDRDLEHEAPDQLPEGVELVRLPTGDPAGAPDIRALFMAGDTDALHAKFGGDRGTEYMREGAARLVTEQTAIYARFLGALARPDAGPVLFHCSAGKDRAGWAASTVLLALGVGEPHLVDHYLLSNEHFDIASVQPKPAPSGSGLAELMRPLARVEAAYVGASLAAVKEHFGGVDGYLEALEIGPAERTRLHENWLEG